MGKPRVHLAQHRGASLYCGRHVTDVKRIAEIKGAVARGGWFAEFRDMGCVPGIGELCKQCVAGWEEHTGIPAVALTIDEEPEGP